MTPHPHRPDDPHAPLPLAALPSANEAPRFGRGCAWGLLLGFLGWCLIMVLLTWIWR